MKKIRIRGRCIPSVWSKVFRLMKLTILFFMVGLMHVTASVYSQSTKLSLDLRNSTVLEVLNEIENQSEFHFAYSSELIDLERKVSVVVNEKNIDQTLKALFKGTSVKYAVHDRHIMLYPEDMEEPKQGAQQKAVSGKATDENGEALPGVTIVVKGTTTGSVTDMDGNYTISNIPDGAILQFSFVGMLTQELEVGDQTTIDVTLMADAIGLEEVVAIGYGTKKKENLTAAVVVVDDQVLENRPLVNVTEMLQGTVANLNITTTSSAPGKTPDINIRGYTGRNSTASPLIVIDGVPGDIDLLNPNDVESISVLKDAAASAIYGSRAPNGVIIITTKGGGKNTAMTVSFDHVSRISTPIGLPKSLNSYDFVLHNNMAGYNSLRSPEYPESTIARIRDFIDGKITDNNIIENGKWGFAFTSNANEDYYGIAFRESVYNHSENLSLRGGSEKTSYFASIGYKRNQGVYNTSIDEDVTKNASIKIDSEINKWLKVGISTRYTNNSNVRPNIRGGSDNDANFMASVAFRPNIPNVNRVGDLEGINEFSILPSLLGDGGKVDRYQNNYIINLYGELTPLNGLKIRGSYAVNIDNQQDQISTFVYSVVEPDGSITRSRRSANTEELKKWRNNNIYQNADVTATYNKEFDKHNITLLAGYQQELNEYDQLYARNTDFYTTSTPAFSTMYGDNKIIDDQMYSWANQGYFGRISYNYEGRYLIDINSRYDASSRYSPETRWTFFPSVSAAYNIARESFWPLKEKISMFKLKGSWGKLGNAGTGRPLYISPLGTGAQISEVLGGTRPPYVSMPGIVSSDLTWTKPRTIGFGVEMGALNNRLQFSYDWYQRTIFDEVGVAEQLPEVLGTNPPAKNNAVSETRGWEVSLAWKDKAFNLGGEPIRYGASFFMSDYIGYVVEYVDNITGNRSGWTPGQKFGVVYGYESRGIQVSAEDLQNGVVHNNNWFYPGDLAYKDLNGDGRINNGDGNYWYSEGDRTELGYNYPRYKYGGTLTAGWKGIDLRVLLDGVGHQVIFKNNKFTTGVTGIGSRGLLDFQGEMGYWTNDNQDAFFPRLYRGTNNFNLANDQYAQNLAHLRVKNISLSYTVPKSLIKWKSLANLAVNFSIENAFMIYDKSWSPFDPQFLISSTYPPSRIYAIGLKVDLQ